MYFMLHRRMCLTDNVTRATSLSLSLSLALTPIPSLTFLSYMYVCRDQVRGSGWVGYHFSKLCGRGIKWGYARSLLLLSLGAP